MDKKDSFACMRAFSVSLALMLKDMEGICIHLNKDPEDEVFSDAKLIVYKEKDIMKIMLSPKGIKHGQKILLGDKK